MKRNKTLLLCINMCILLIHNQTQGFGATVSTVLPGYYRLSILPAWAKAISLSDHNSLTELLNDYTEDLTPELKAIVTKEIGSKIPVKSCCAAKPGGKSLRNLILIDSDYKDAVKNPETENKQLAHVRSVLHHEAAHIKNKDYDNIQNFLIASPLCIITAQKLMTTIYPTLQKTRLYKSGFRKGILHGILNGAAVFGCFCAYSCYREAQADEAIPNTKEHLSAAIDFFEILQQKYGPQFDPLHPSIPNRIARFKERLAAVETQEQKKVNQ